MREEKLSCQQNNLIQNSLFKLFKKKKRDKTKKNEINEKKQKKLRENQDALSLQKNKCYNIITIIGMQFNELNYKGEIEYHVQKDFDTHKKGY